MCVLTLITAFTAVIVAIVAIQQFLLAKEKFKLDLFEKRHAVFKGVELFLYEIVINRKVTIENIQKYNLDTQTARFIFDEDVSKFIEDVRSKARDLKRLKENMEELPQGEERHKIFKQFEALQMELYDMDQTLVLKFSPYLKFRRWKHGLIWELR
jgi:hypothetical protein